MAEGRRSAHRGTDRALPIAVVGLACRFPDADDPPALLDVVLTGRRAFRRVPPGRLDLADYYSADPAAADATYSTRAAVLEGWQFDHPAFGISRRDFLSADPAHWLALETAARALAAAGFPGGAGLDRDRVGVVIGNTLGGDTSRAAGLRLRWPYVRRVLAEAMLAGQLPAESAGQLMRRAEARFLAPFPTVTESSLAGSAPATISARICGHFGFRGGGLAVDGACASGLLAVTSACAALESADVDVVIAGGVDLSLDPLDLVGLAKTGVLATDDVRIYDEDPTGYLPGEGCGLVVLMRAAEARAARLPVYAEIAGWGMSSPGRPTVTGADAGSQLLALGRAYERAGVDPADVQLIEGHGAGTATADRAELDALTRLRAGARQQAALGSIKASIGHAGAAAGAAGLIKTVLALGTGVIPPATGVSRPHPLLRDGEAGLRLPRSPEAWPEGTRLAAVSAMGSSGLNVHVVLRSEPAARSLRGRVAGARGPLTGARPATEPASAPPVVAGSPPALCFLLHAPDRLRLTAVLSRLVQIAPWLSDGQLHDLACQLASEADVQGQARVAIVASRPALLARLASEALHLLPQLSGGLLTVRPGIFAADGADGRVTLLLSDDRSAVGQAARVTASGDGGPVAAITAGQARPAAGTGGPLAALGWLNLLGVRATAAVGHGLGEIAGLAWAGCLTDADAALLASLRAQILAETAPADTGLTDPARPDAGVADPELAGAGLAHLGQATRGLADSGLADSGLAGSGLAEAAAALIDPGLAEAAAALAGRAGAGRDAAAVLAAISERQRRLRTVAGQFRFAPPCRRLISASTGRELASAAEVADLLWAGSAPASRLTEALAAGAVGATLMIETGPGQVLAETSAQLCRVPSVSLGAGRDSTRQAMRAAAALFAAGALGEAAPLYAGQPRRPFDLWREQVFLTSPCQADPGPAAIALASGRPALALLDAAASTGDRDSLVIEAAAIARTITGRPADSPADLEPRQNAAVTMTVTGPASHDDPARPEAGRLPVRRRSPAVGETQASPAAAITSISGTSTGDSGPADSGTGDSGTGDTGYDATERGDTGHDTAPRHGAGVRPAWPASAPALVAGIGPWVRCYAEELRPPAVPMLPAGDGPWRVLLAPGHPFGPAGGELFRDDRTAGRSLVMLGDQADPDTCAAALQAARDAISTGELVVLTDGPGTAGFWASLHAEHPDLGVTVLRVPPTPAGLRAAASWAATVPGELRELDIDSAGRVRQPVMAPAELTAGGSFPLGTDDVVLVSRGTRGAGLVLAQVLACCGAAVAVIGRAAPDEDDRVVTRIEQLRKAGAKVSFEIVDIANSADMNGALQRIERRLGPVTAVGHATGPSVSIPIAQLTDAYLRGYAAAENASLTSLVNAIKTRPLRLIATFGSVAGRYGLPGEGLLALAGGTLASAAERLAASMPACRAVHVDWAPWADDDLTEPGRLAESLRQAGVTPITAGSASRLLLKMLATPDLPGRLAVHGRAGAPAPVAIGAAASQRPGRGSTAAEPAASRFLEVTRLHYPGVELVSEARLSLATDPYLGDYRMDGLPVLPPVMALEAMAQAASFLAGRPLRRATAVIMNAPVAVPARGDAVIRLCALADRGTVTVALRCEESGFGLDHYRAEFGPDDQLPEADQGPAAEQAGSPGESAAGQPTVLDGADLYGQLCFQSGRFRLIAGLTEVTGRSCRALARPADDRPWFSAAPAGQPGRGPAAAAEALTTPDEGLVLGSAGLHDATLHAVQACVPDRRLEPAGCDTAVFSGRLPDGAIDIRAVAVPVQHSTGQHSPGQHSPAQTGAGQTSANQLSAEHRGLSGISTAIPRPRQPTGLTIGADGSPGPAGLAAEATSAAAGPDSGPSSNEPAELVWDVTATDSTGQRVVTWRRLRFRDAGPLPRTEPWPAPLLAVHLQRAAVALGLDPALRVLIEPPQRPASPLSPAPPVGRQPPAAGSGGQRPPAVPPQRARTADSQGAGLDGFSLAVQGAEHAFCAWAVVAPSQSEPSAREEAGHPGQSASTEDSSQAGHGSQPEGRSRPGRRGKPDGGPAPSQGLGKLTAELHPRLDEPPEATAARLRAIGDCLSAAGAPASHAALLDPPAEPGWVVVSAAGALLACTVVDVAGVRRPVAVAIMTGRPQRAARTSGGQRRSAKTSARRAAPRP